MSRVVTCLMLLCWQVWELVHKGSGYSALVIAIATIYTGLRRLVPTVQSYTIALYFAWVALCCAGAGVLEWLRWHRGGDQVLDADLESNNLKPAALPATTTPMRSSSASVSAWSVGARLAGLGGRKSKNGIAVSPISASHSPSLLAAVEGDCRTSASTTTATSPSPSSPNHGPLKNLKLSESATPSRQLQSSSVLVSESEDRRRRRGQRRPLGNSYLDSENESKTEAPLTRTPPVARLKYSRPGSVTVAVAGVY